MPLKSISSGQEKSVKPSRRWERLSWAMGVSLVAPLDVRNEKEVATVAHLARDLVLRKTTLDQEFPRFVYDRANWLRDQSRAPTTVASSLAVMTSAKGRSPSTAE